MRLIGAGLPRTGTLSQKVALEMLGLGPCYHMVTVLGDLEQAPLWAGQSAELVHGVRSAGELVETIVKEAEAALYSVTTYSNDAQQTSAKSAS